MEKKREVRNPKQTRGINTKEKIVEAAYDIFAQKNYYKVNSSEIAKAAGVSIGCFYSYFKDKDAIFLEVLNLYNNSFLEVVNMISNKIDIDVEDKEKWLHLIINKLINVHVVSKDLSKQITLMKDNNPMVADILDKQYEKVINIIKDFLRSNESDIKVSDIEAAAIVIFIQIDAIVHMIVFEKNTIDSERIIKSSIESICKYLCN